MTAEEEEPNGTQGKKIDRKKKIIFKSHAVIGLMTVTDGQIKRKPLLELY